MAKKKRKRKGYIYGVQRQVKGGTHTMLQTSDYKKAVAFYHKHPRAYGIQRYVREKDGSRGWTAGLLQPRIPSKIKYRGKQYSRCYVGPHQKRFAKKLAKGLRKSPPIKGAVAKKFKKGWFVFAR